MIKRIQNITSIGKFADCKVPGCEFGSTTIVFGFNTQGKSTLTAIFRSLQSGNNDILIGRKTFGATKDQKIEFDIVDETNTNKKFVYSNDRWNNTYENILIFDSKFVAENVFEGETISFDQQKNLNTIIIGKKGQDLNAEIVALQAEGDRFTELKRELNKEFSRHITTTDSKAFCLLPVDSAIDQKITDKQKEIDFEKDKEAIKTAVENYIKRFSGIKFDLRDTLAKTLDAKQDEIEEHIKQHFVKQENAENFLSDGVDFLKTKPGAETRSCVFCGQELGVDAEKLIATYSAYFKGGYATLQKEMQEAIEYFTTLNLEAGLSKIAADLTAKGINIGLTEAKVTELAELKTDLEKELVKKTDLNYKINFASFDALKTAITSFKEALEDIKVTRLDIPSVKTATLLENELAKLKLIKKRQETKWSNFCTELTGTETESEKIRVRREAKRAELEKHSAKIFDEHKDTINSLCSELGADFEIADFKPLKKLVGKDERIFALKFFGTHKVSIDGTDDRKPTFKNTLSESDRRLLAFAFFLSLLKHDANLKSKVIIFDDPMTSFDYERKRKTIHLITDISSTVVVADGSKTLLYPRQKIVLTHEHGFARELSRLAVDAITLKIIDDVNDGTKCSKIAHSDFTKDLPEDDIPIRIEKIAEVLAKRTFTTDFELDCRVVLEHVFKRKYYLELKDDVKNRKSVRSFTLTLGAAKINGFDEATKQSLFIRLCNDLNIEMHDGATQNSNGDKESIIKDFFTCLKAI